MTELFKIFQLSAEDAEKIERETNHPHNHDFEELIIGVKGQLEHFIDFKSQIFKAPFVSFVTRGKVHRVQPSPLDGECEMWVMRFKSEFIPETTFQLYSYYHENANICLQDNDCFKRLALIARLIFQEYHQSAPDLAVIRQLLSALFTMIESEKRKQNVGNEELKKTQSITFKNFLHILELNYKSPEGVQFYADKLFMTTRNLNLICQNILQQSVSEIIDTRKLIEAKNLLITTDKTIAEIGFDLGYNEKTYFTHAFKKKSGQSPSEFRQAMRKIISQ